MIDHTHDRHKELDRFIHVAKNVEQHSHQLYQAKVNHSDHHHIIDVHVNYDENLSQKAQLIEQIKAKTADICKDNGNQFNFSMEYLKQINTEHDSEEVSKELLKDEITKEYVTSHQFEEMGNKSAIKVGEADHLWDKK